MRLTQFMLNGKPQSLGTSSEMPLLWALRETLSLTGTKFGRGMALCGACTAHLNGEPMRFCVTPISRVPGARARQLPIRMNQAVCSVWEALRASELTRDRK